MHPTTLEVIRILGRKGIPQFVVGAGRSFVSRSDAEFKYDERDGLFKILEVNTRPYAYVGFPAGCGVDLVAMAYRDALNLPVEPVTAYAIGCHYFFPAADRVAGWRLIQE